MTNPIELLVQSIQKSALPGVWSKGVALSREKAVLLDRRSPKAQEGSSDEIVLRVRSPGRSVAAKVTLWPHEEDAYCDCGDRNEPCHHIVAAVVALKNNCVAGNDEQETAPANTLIQYRLTRKNDLLAFERLLLIPNRPPEKLQGTLVSIAGGISSGRVQAPPLAATKEDYAIDQLLGSAPRDCPERGSWPRLLSVLKDLSRVTLDGQTVNISAQPLGWRATVNDDSSGFRVRLFMDPAITEVFRNGAVLSGGTLHPLSEASFNEEERRIAAAEQGIVFRSDDATRLVTEVLPGLQRKVAVEIATRRLPELKATPPHMLLHFESLDAHTLSVTPRLIYGDPPIAELQNGRIVSTSSRWVCERDLAEEKRLCRELQDELNLQPGQPVRFHGEEAARFRLKTRSWKTTGESGAKFLPSAPLIPEFNLDSRGGIHLVFKSAGQEVLRQADPSRVFQAWRENSDFVPLLGGGWAPLPHDWLERYGDRIEALLNEQNLRGRPPSFRIPEIISLVTELGELGSGTTIPENFRLLRERLENFHKIPDAVILPNLAGLLRDYQRKGVNWLSFLRENQLGALLADDMGLGKTLQALSVIKGRTLVICPTSVMQAWREQIGLFRPDLKVAAYHGTERVLDPSGSAGSAGSAISVTLTTYGILRLDQDLLASTDWDLVILDEAQAIRNAESQLAQACFRLRASFRMALSGTPIENRLEDLWSQMNFLNPGLLGSREEFQENFVTRIGRGDPSALAQLRRKIKPFILRRLKQEVAPELPPRTETVLHCELSQQEKDLYQSLLASTRKEVLDRLEAGEGVFAALELLLRLRQACCHPGLVPGASPTESSSKLELLAQSLETSISAGHRALVFSQWTSLLDRIEARLSQSGISFSRLDGSTRNREEVIASFQNENGPSVMLLSLKAGGVGLTLTAADHVYIIDPWWNPAAEDQAADRAHRIGQENPVLIQRLVAKDTVEDKILLLQKKKREIAAGVLQGAASAAALTREDLLDLLI